MLLREMFSPLGAPKDGQPDIDWLDDLKFYMDNDSGTLNKYFFPAVDKHKKYLDHPKAYTIYIKPIQRSLKSYCEKFEVEDPEEKFPQEKLIELAKRICAEQSKHIERGDYKQD
jgi:hypothetical protein